MTDNRSLLKLTPEQREDLQRWAQSRTLPAGDVFRARLILALADGNTYREIARSLKTGRIGGLGGPSSGQQAACRNADHPGTRDPASAAKAWGREHALVLQETSSGVGAQQVHGTADSGPSPTETAPTGTVYGQQRSGFRKQSG
jgi:hypothetical protein